MRKKNEPQNNEVYNFPHQDYLIAFLLGLELSQDWEVDKILQENLAIQSAHEISRAEKEPGE